MVVARTTSEPHSVRVKPCRGLGHRPAPLSHRPSPIAHRPSPSVSTQRETRSAGMFKRSEEMIQRIVVAVAVFIVSLEVNAQSCKEPLVAQRLLADDVRYASPFYVIALPKNPQTEQMDNICYSYFENGDNFFHIMSITYKNGTNSFYTYTKGDLSNRLGLAVGSGILDSQCVFHDYTLTPICNSTVFILYRCFVGGNCNSNIDIGITPGVDVRVVLAANPIISPECRVEAETSLQNTSALAGNSYVILPQRLAPQCITRYNNTDSIGKARAVGSKQVTDDELVQRFGFGDDQGTVQTNTVTQPPQTVKLPLSPAKSTFQGVKPAAWPVNSEPSTKTAYNPYGTTVKSSGARPGYTTAPAWAVNGNYWPQGADQWRGQTMKYGSEMHHHVWQSQAQPQLQLQAQSPAGLTTRTVAGGNPNVFYHIHSWNNPPPGCCRCN